MFQEPNFQTAETTVAFENNADLEPTKNIRVNHVFCLYTKRVEALKVNDVSRYEVNSYSFLFICSSLPSSIPHHRSYIFSSNSF